MPGFISGQPLSGRQVGQAIFQFLPALPGEGPPFMPRVLAKALFPRGFAPGMIAALPAEIPRAPLIPPAVPAAPPVAPAQPPVPAMDARGNAILRREPKAAPPVTRGISSGGDPIGARSLRVQIRERPGL